MHNFRKLKELRSYGVMELRQRLLSNRSTFGRFACKELLMGKEKITNVITP